MFFSTFTFHFELQKVYHDLERTENTSCDAISVTVTPRFSVRKYGTDANVRIMTSGTTKFSRLDGLPLSGCSASALRTLELRYKLPFFMMLLSISLPLPPHHLPPPPTPKPTYYNYLNTESSTPRSRGTDSSQILTLHFIKRKYVIRRLLIRSWEKTKSLHF